MRGHAERFGMPSPPKRIIATGGASANHSILSELATIFGCNVYTVQKPGNLLINQKWKSRYTLGNIYVKGLFCWADSASLGAALRAAHGWLCKSKGSFVPISSMYKDKLDKTAFETKLVATAQDDGLVAKYGQLVKKRMEIENQLVHKLGCWWDALQ